MTRTLHGLSEAEFKEGWRRIVGEAPAIVLANRNEMVLALVESVPALPLPGDPAPQDARREPAKPPRAARRRPAPPPPRRPPGP